MDGDEKLEAHNSPDKKKEPSNPFLETPEEECYDNALQEDNSSDENN